MTFVIPIRAARMADVADRGNVTASKFGMSSTSSTKNRNALHLFSTDLDTVECFAMKY